MAWRALALLALGALLAGRAPAQEPRARQWTGSARAATVQLNDTMSFGALGGVIEYRALSWLAVGAAPTLVRVTSNGSTTSGLGDLPLALEASSQSGAPLKPAFGAAIMVLLPTGNAACGLGNGVTSAGLQLGAGIAPSEAVHLSADASRSVSGAITLSSLDQPQATWVDIGGDVDVAPRWTVSLSAGGDVGGTSPGPADREVGGGVSYAVGGSLDLTVDVTHRVAGAAPQWGLAVSLGTSSTGISPLNSVSPLGRQHQVFVGGVSKLKSKSSGTTGC